MSEYKKERKLQVGGTIYADRHIYITRKDIEDEIYNTLINRLYCNILSSRQVGKSSIMSNVALRLMAKGVQVATIDIAGELGSPKSPGVWYQGLLGKIAARLGLPFSSKEWLEGNKEATANQKLLSFFRDEIPSHIGSSLVVFLDEIDRTLKLDFTDDFFTAIRSMYNQRGVEDSFSKVTFCLVGVVSPSELIKDPRTTAYNVGKTFEIRDFNFKQDDFSELTHALSKDSKTGLELLEAIYEWTNGHPYLTLWLCEKTVGRGFQSAN